MRDECGLEGGIASVGIVVIVGHRMWKVDSKRRLQYGEDRLTL